MMECMPSSDGKTCIVCGWVKSEKIIAWPRRLCHYRGPGDYLHDAILKWVGEGPTRECGCTDRINQMNAWGVVGCREHIEEIVDWLVEEASKRGWWKLAVMLPGSRMFIRSMVNGAIDAAIAAQSDGS